LLIDSRLAELVLVIGVVTPVRAHRSVRGQLRTGTDHSTLTALGV